MKKGDTFIRSEQYYGNRYRALALPQDVDAGKAEAKYEGGLLD